MRNIREVLRLKFDCRLTKRQIATSCKIARSTVSEYLRRMGPKADMLPVAQSTTFSGPCGELLTPLYCLSYHIKMIMLYPIS